MGPGFRVQITKPCPGCRLGEGMFRFGFVVLVESTVFSDCGVSRGIGLSPDDFIVRGTVFRAFKVFSHILCACGEQPIMPDCVLTADVVSGCDMNHVRAYVSALFGQKSPFMVCTMSA